jgi:drug/metabolite transporter (DMT)-like permease
VSGGALAFALGAAVLHATWNLILARADDSRAATAAALLTVRATGVAAVKTQLGPATVVAGLATFGAYGLVLAALQRAPAAPVAAVRETSIVLAVGAGALLLREPVTRARWLGAVAVTAGVCLVALG